MLNRSLDLLLVEDDEEFRTTLALWMSRAGHRVEQAASGMQALAHFEQKRFDVAIVDMNMPGMTGLELLAKLREKETDTEIIILTGQATVENAVEAMKLGAFDYLNKPFALADLERRANLAADRGRLKHETQQWREVVRRQQTKTEMVGSSMAMEQVFRMVSRIAATDKSVLVLGESGTGKELVARSIQEKSLRAGHPFVTINCAALPESLVESELFGHEKGAFTGAVNRKNGLFEVADGGTLFIDEIGELPLSLQPKLLRVLEDGSLRHVGSHQERRVNVRVIAATNRDLEKEVRAGRFREDLYYRINVFNIHLPPLRERGADISMLIDKMLGDQFRMENSARDLLTSYAWPGNVRQLMNVLDRAMILAENQVITVYDLPREIMRQTLESRPASSSQYVESSMTTDDSSEDDLASIEKAHIISVLKKEKGNKARAARVLGIHRRKLYRLMERFGIKSDHTVMIRTTVADSPSVAVGHEN